MSSQRIKIKSTEKIKKEAEEKEDKKEDKESKEDKKILTNLKSLKTQDNIDSNIDSNADKKAEKKSEISNIYNTQKKYFDEKIRLQMRLRRLQIRLLKDLIGGILAIDLNINLFRNRRLMSICMKKRVLKKSSKKNSINYMAQVQKKRKV
jgi:hypothetical protein